MYYIYATHVTFMQHNSILHYQATQYIMGGYESILRCNCKAARKKIEQSMARAKDKVPRGYIPILIGQGEDREKILVHMEHLQQPYFIELLDLAVQEFGYEQQGILHIPCTTKVFRSIIGTFQKAKS
jgi:SAUR family protein